MLTYNRASASAALEFERACAIVATSANASASARNMAACGQRARIGADIAPLAADLCEALASAGTNSLREARAAFQRIARQRRA